MILNEIIKNFQNIGNYIDIKTKGMLKKNKLSIQETHIIYNILKVNDWFKLNQV